MNNIILDYFSLTDNFSVKSFDESENADYQISAYEMRKPTEDLYRFMNMLGLLKPENEWIIDYEQEDGIVSFSIDIRLILQKKPQVDAYIRNNLGRASVERWKQLVMISYAE